MEGHKVTEKKTIILKDQELKRDRTKKNQLDGQYVLMNWWCGICKSKWRSEINRGDLKRFPSHVYTKEKGRRILAPNGQTVIIPGRKKKVETRLPDGSMIRAHKDCAQKLLMHLEQEEIRKKGRKRIIIT